MGPRLYLSLLIGFVSAWRPCYGSTPVVALASDASIVLDGVLSETEWGMAEPLDEFYEVWPGDRTPPRARTEARFLYDERCLYVGIRAFDANPEAIRMPLVDRDAVFSDQDYVEVFVDPSNQRRSAQIFRTNARGVQGDAQYNADTGGEDFAADFDWFVRATVDSGGWTAEYRIPVTTFRSPGATRRTWAILVYRNYPRSDAYQMSTGAPARGTSCFFCHGTELHSSTLFPAIGRAGSVVVTPEITAMSSWRTQFGGVKREATEARPSAGLEWTPRSGVLVSATVNPDFSQVGADALQLRVNKSFALYYPENRPFFVEASDLLETPMRAVHTRTIAEPLAGARLTSRGKRADATLLAARDDVGGSLVLPGARSSEVVLRTVPSTAVIGRYRRSVGAGTAAALFTGRWGDDLGYNVVVGPNWAWKVGQRCQFTGQALASHTRDAERPEWNGSSHAVLLDWRQNPGGWGYGAFATDVGDRFRADDGFVAQNDYRAAAFDVSHAFHPRRFLVEVRPYVQAAAAYTRTGRRLSRTTSPGIELTGSRSVTVRIELHPSEVGPTMHGAAEHSYSSVAVRANPLPRIPRVEVSTTFGEQIDVDNDRVGKGRSAHLGLRVRPVDALDLEGSADRQWLDVPAQGSAERLFVETAVQCVATWHLDVRTSVRVTGQSSRATREPGLFAAPVPARTTQSLLNVWLSWRRDARTGVSLGGAWQRVRDDGVVNAEFHLVSKISLSFRS